MSPALDPAEGSTSVVITVCDLALHKGETVVTEILRDTRSFSVRARHVDVHHARLVEEPTFEAAAIAYIEDFPLSTDGGPDISVIVRDVDSGQEHCFHIDLETGETAPCR